MTKNEAKEKATKLFNELREELGVSIAEDIFGEVRLVSLVVNGRAK